MELNSKHKSNRIINYNSLVNYLALLSDQQLLELLSQVKLLGNSNWGVTALLEIFDIPIFVKKIPLTEIERLPQNRMSTKNLFSLPTFYQYGVGSAGFGVWRELAAHTMSTNWVLKDKCANFPILYHWRELPRTKLELTPEKLEELESSVTYWEGSPQIRERLKASLEAPAEIVLFLEYFPNDLFTWLGKEFSEDAAPRNSIYRSLEKQLETITSFMISEGFIHFDAHFNNIVTDGCHLYFTDFGLATSEAFELSEEELNFLKQHRNYDRCYTMYNLVNWLLKATFGEDHYKEELRQMVSGEEKKLSNAISSTIEKHAPITLLLHDFFEKLRKETKKTPYPNLELVSSS
jgi:hypothetical protein